jgi:hypothetical protein
MSAAPRRGHGVEVAREQQRRVRRAGEQARVAEVAEPDAGGAQQLGDVGGEAGFVARLRRDVDQLERPIGKPRSQVHRGAQ